MKSRTFQIAIALGMAVAVSAQAQSMQETVSKLGVTAGKAYVAPIVSAFGANLNGGWYHKAPPPKRFGVNFEAGAVTMATFLSGGEKTFSTVGSFRLDSAHARELADETIDTNGTFGQGQRLRDSATAAIRRTDVRVNFAGPTIIGEKEAPMTYEVLADPFTINTSPTTDTTIILDPIMDSIRDPGGDPIGFGLLNDLKALPLVAPQITIGTIYGTNVTLRWLPETKTTDEIGKVKFFGFGIQHNPAVWMNSKMPVDLSVGYFTQTLSVGTLFKAQSQAVGLNVSKTLGWRLLNVTPYGGVQFEKSTFDFSYDLVVDGEEIPIDFSVNGDNKVRATAGLSVRLLFLNINADYNIGKYNSVTAGVMVGI